MNAPCSRLPGNPCSCRQLSGLRVQQGWERWGLAFSLHSALVIASPETLGQVLPSAVCELTGRKGDMQQPWPQSGLLLH